MHSDPILPELPNPMHSDYCREMEGDALVIAPHLLLDTSATFPLSSKVSKNSCNCDTWKMQQYRCYTTMLDFEVVVNRPTAFDA